MYEGITELLPEIEDRLSERRFGPDGEVVETVYHYDSADLDYLLGIITNAIEEFADCHPEYGLDDWGSILDAAGLLRDGKPYLGGWTSNLNGREVMALLFGTLLGSESDQEILHGLLRSHSLQEGIRRLKEIDSDMKSWGDPEAKFGYGRREIEGLPQTPGDAWERIDRCCRMASGGNGMELLVGVANCLFSTKIEKKKLHPLIPLTVGSEVTSSDEVMRGHGLCGYVLDKANGEDGYDADAFAKALEQTLRDSKPTSADPNVSVRFERRNFEAMGSRAIYDDYYIVHVPAGYVERVGGGESQS